MSYDELSMGLKPPFWSVMTPATTYVRPESENPTDQLVFLPEDGDTKQADPESWKTDKDFEKSIKVNKKLGLSLPRLGLKIFVVSFPNLGDEILNYVDNKRVPLGEIWVSNLERNKAKLLKTILYCFLVVKNNYTRDDAKRTADSIYKALSIIEGDQNNDKVR